jgi:hypothetical protein
MNEKFELKKIRDFGQVFNDTFAFFKDNLKPLLSALFVICGFFMLIGAIGSATTYLNMSGVLDGNSYDSGRSISLIGKTFATTFIMLITQFCINLVTLCYMAVYNEHNSKKGTLADVWNFFKYYFWRVFGASILLGMLTVIACLFIFIPGIYLGVVFSLVPSIIVMENASISEAFNKCFRLIRSRWWFVFGVLFVISIIVGIANSIAGVPLGMVPVLGKLISNQMATAPLVIFFSILRSLLVVTYSLTAIAIALCYFSLSEQKDGTGLMARIDDFGKAAPEDVATSQEPTEEY